MSDPHDYDDDHDDGECPNCGGEGYVFDCIDGCCVDADIGCDLCTHRCDWCNAPKRKAETEEVLGRGLEP
jgi:hypothetical protein